MKAVISNRIYLNCDKGSDLDHYLMKELTYEIDQQPVSPYPLFIHNMIRFSDTIVTIPSGRLDLIPEGYEIVDKRCFKGAEISQPTFTPRPSQQEAIDLFTESGLVEAPVGFGKTIVGLGLAHRLQLKTLVVTTTTTIRDMWIEEIENFFDFEAGIIGGGKYKTDAPIVVGNIQTVRNRCNDLADEFGLVIIDEVHRSPAKTFTESLNALRAAYKIGLSGTMERKDGLHVVLPDYFGHQRFVGEVENVMKPTVHLYDTGIELSANEFIPWSIKINELMANPKYRQQVINLATIYVEAGHKVLVLADRTEFLKNGHLATEDFSLILTGEQKGIELRREIMSAVADHPKGIALWGTQSIWAEGVSLNELSTVILATPINNPPLLKQIGGRVMRTAEGKLNPVIVDLGFSGSSGKRHRNTRRKVYIENGWELKNMKMP